MNTDPIIQGQRHPHRDMSHTDRHPLEMYVCRVRVTWYINHGNKNREIFIPGHAFLPHNAYLHISAETPDACKWGQTQAARWKSGVTQLHPCNFCDNSGPFLGRIFLGLKCLWLGYDWLLTNLKLSNDRCASWCISGNRWILNRLYRAYTPLCRSRYKSTFRLTIPVYPE